MIGWIVYDLATLAGKRYRTAITPPDFDAKTEGLLNVPAPPTAFRVVDVRGKITFEPQPDIKPAKTIVTRERALEIVDAALNDWAVDDAAKLRMLLATLLVKTRRIE